MHFREDLKPGTPLLDGHYVIQSYLNTGGFGITYMARDNVDRTVVVKECFPGAVCHRSGTMVRARSRKYAEAFANFVANFLAEARALAKVDHPNIVGVHQVFEENGTAYMVIDYIDGRDLRDILASPEAGFNPVEVVALLGQMLSAVDYLHKLGILHRDIAPDNILIDRTGKPVLIDFGEARQDLTPQSRIVTERHVVKDGYSPQELYLTGAEQTAASDLYSLGATFHHVITGRAPPSSQKRMAALAMGEADPCPGLAGRIKGYPAAFLEAIDAAMRVFPKDRLQSAGDWIARVKDSLAPHDPRPEAGSDRSAPVAEALAVKSDTGTDRLASLPAGGYRLILIGAAILLLVALAGVLVYPG